MTHVISKETSNNGTLHVREIDYHLAKKICVENHYSKKWNSAFGKVNFGIYKDGIDRCLGVAVFGNMMNPKSYSKIADGIGPENVIELNRLWVDDELTKNAESVFLSLCFKYIKAYHKDIKIVQSFADGRLGCGTIYKATNFRYYGASKSLFFRNKETGEVQHKVPFENTLRLPRMCAENLKLAQGKYEAFEVKTYRYIYVLDKKLRNKIRLKEVSYPKYEKGEYPISGYQQSLPVMGRVLYTFDKLGLEGPKSDVKRYIEDNYGIDDIHHIYANSINGSLLTYFNDTEKEQKLEKALINLMGA